MARRRRADIAPRRLILDAGAVIALARGDQRVRAYLARAIELGAPVEIPVVVVAETVRGSAKDAGVHRVLKAVDAIPPATESIGRLAGQLLGRAGSAATVDAMVVAQAVERGGGLILTADRDDLGPLAARHPEVWIQAL